MVSTLCSSATTSATLHLHLTVHTALRLAHPVHHPGLGRGHSFSLRDAHIKRYTFRMLPSAQLLTAPISLADYKPKDITTTARSLVSSSFLFLQVDRDLAREEARMAGYNARPSSRSDQREELWFSMPSNVVIWFKPSTK